MGKLKFILRTRTNGPSAAWSVASNHLLILTHQTSWKIDLVAELLVRQTKLTDRKLHMTSQQPCAVIDDSQIHTRLGGN